jgi:hypothetical protein
MTIMSLEVFTDRSFIDTSLFTFDENPVKTFIPLRKVHIALLSSRVSLKLATGKVYLPLPSGTG